jgi:hypothetical protein
MSTLSVNSVSNLTGGYGFRNRLINAQGLVNQRAYVSGTNTSGANQYTLDRWRVVTSGENLTFSTSENEVTFTAPAGGVEQVIEGLNLETGTYVLSWTGTATATVGGSSVANGGTVSVTGGTNTTVRFSGGTFKYPQFERGNTPSSFERRPYGTELSLCQRYFYRWSSAAAAFQILANGTVISNTEIDAAFFLPVTMRATPTATFSASSTFFADNGTSLSSATLAFIDAYPTAGCIRASGLSGLTVNQSRKIRANNSTAASVAFNSEL